MKKPFVVLFDRESRLTKVGYALQQYGCRVEDLSRADKLMTCVKKERPDLLLLERDGLAELAQTFGEARGAGASAPPVILAGDAGPVEFQDLIADHLPQPLDAMALHQVLQKNLDRFPRKHLRMAVRLPGVFFVQDRSQLCDILSLGTGGAFIKTPSHQFRPNESIELVVPLLGMKQELEISGQVVYQVMPVPENNFQEGVGVQFDGVASDDVALLQKYLGYSLLTEYPGPAGAASSSQDANQAGRSAAKAATLGAAARMHMLF